MKEHPVIKELFVNEDGSKVVYKGLPKKIMVTKKPDRHYPLRAINMLRQTIPLAKLVCETYNGMRLDKSFVIQRKDFNPENYHYSNLFWGKNGSRIRTKRTKRHKNSKIKQEEIPVVVKRLNDGETLRAIAKSYNTSDMTISRIKKIHITDPKLKLKEAVKIAKDKNEIDAVVANFLGYETKGKAMQAMGAFEFLNEVDKNLKSL